MSQPARKATADDLAATYGEDARVEVIGGEMLPKAAPRTTHSAQQGAAVATLHRRFHRRAPGRWPGGWWILPELHVQYAIHDVYCHDICGFRRDLHAEIPPTWPVKLRPDWVLEALSPSHEKRDLIDKWRVLHASGVPHYWVLHPDEKLLQIHRWNASGYNCVLNAGPDETIRAEPFESVELSTNVLFGDEDDEE